MVYTGAGKTLGKPVHIVVNDPTTSIRPLMAGYVGNPDYEPSMFVDAAIRPRILWTIIQLLVVVDTNKPSYTECPDLLYLSQDHCGTGSSSDRGSEVITECSTLLCGAVRFFYL